MLPLSGSLMETRFLLPVFLRFLDASLLLHNRPVFPVSVSAARLQFVRPAPQLPVCVAPYGISALFPVASPTKCAAV